MSHDYLSRILTARVYDVAEETPLDRAAGLSARMQNQVWLKREDEQPIFSFKLRGAYNKMSRLPRRVITRGVVAASAGNHAQGVALAAEKLRVPARVFMPVTTPSIKVEAVRARGAEVELVGDSYSEAGEHARKFARRERREFIAPYDDPDIIAGNGTIALEVLKQHQGALDVVFVPVGGGGLIAGIASFLKQVRPEVSVVGVEPVDSDAMRRSLARGRRVRLKEVGLFADGVAVKQVGRETFALVRRFVDEVVVVDTDEICAAIKDVFEDTRSIMEPAGALAVAGLKRYVAERGCRRRELVAVLSGANMNFDRLRHVSERAEIGERREAILAVTIPERPGSFKSFCSLIGDRNISEFNYRYSDPDQATVFAGIQVRDSREVDRVVRTLSRHGYPTVDLTDNEMAKLHVRHMVGGRAPQATNEVVYRFEFPERPGALLGFLERMGSAWNISMFHYRNHGAEIGRVLCAIQVPPAEKGDLRLFLRSLGYAFAEETANPAYELFLS